MTHAVKAVDLFAGWGGFTAGAEAAGVDVVWAGNHSDVAVKTHAANHPNTTHVCQDLRQADWTSLPDFSLLLASPACQGHSSASRPNRRPSHDASRATAWSVVDCAEVRMPEAFIVENVPDFRSWQLYPIWRTALESLGYTLDERILVASRFGVPQRRKRLFVIGTRNGATIGELPESTTEPAFEPCLEPDLPDSAWNNVTDASANVQGRIAAGRRKCGSTFLTQHVTGHSGVPLSEPIRTITTAQNHWNLVDGDRYRPLTGRELCRGMGFPDSTVWDPALNVKQVTRGIGNAVAPPVATAVIAALGEALSW